MDGVRGLAALLVLVRHNEEFWPAEPFHTYLAVDVFFLLSGYVISRAYGEQLRSGSLSAGRFMAIRFIRLYPMFLLSALWAGASYLASALHHGQLGAGSLLTVLFMLFMLPVNLLGTQWLFPLNVPYWSLLFEIVVNNAYALIVRRWSSRAVAALVGLAAVVLIVDALRRGGLDLGYKWNALAISAGLARAIFGILLGALLERHGSDWRITRTLRAHPWLAISALLLILVSPGAGAANGLLDAALVLLALPACVLALDAPVRRPLVGRGLIALGAASYPLYVLHAPAGVITRRLAAAWMPTHPLAVGIVFVLAMVVLCILLERLVDEPTRRRLQRRFLRGGRRTSPGTAMAADPA